MKQHITIEQLQELIPEQQGKLRKLWQPKEGDWFIDLDYEENEMLYHSDSLLEYREKMLNFNNCFTSSFYWSND